MIVVGFDTATDDTAVCASSDGAPAHEVQIGPGEEGRPRHASALLPAVEEAASAAGGWDSVDRIAVGIGPGSFTGLRIGVSTARALAGSLSLPLAPVGTLDALGRAMAARAPDRHRLAVLDARRGEVFAALFDPSGARLWKPLVTPPAELAQRLAELPAAPLAAGSGALRFRAELAAEGAEVPAGSDPLHHVAARDVCAIGAAGEALGPDAVEPIYLRPPDAERWRERDS